MIKAKNKYYLLYIPAILSWLFIANSVTSYLIAWLGSFIIFFLSFSNKIKPTDRDLPLLEKIFKPLFLTQIIFAGYMACTSIFYFLDVMGYEYFTPVYGKQIDFEELKGVAACQRYYCLGHAAFAHGLLFFYRSGIKSKYKVSIKSWPWFCFKLALICSPLGFVFSKIGGLSVLGNSIEGLALVAATLAFALAIPMRQTVLIFLSGIMYGSELLRALTSGFKEPVIVSILMLGLFLYPFYKRLITLTLIPVMFFLFAVLPTYVNTFRGQIGNADADAAKAESLKKVREDFAGGNLAKTNWDFLTGRISEISMFVQYKNSTEERGSLYGFQIVDQAAMALVPRILWRDKPGMEPLVMARVIENGVVSEIADVSAKPQYIVDGYLSAGVVGIWLALFIYGALAQSICNYAQSQFGGYLFGTAFIYTGMFRDMWRGNCFEFIYNNIFYSFVSMMVLLFIFRKMKVVIPVDK